MIRKITADTIHPVSSQPIQHGVILIDDNTGEIIAIENRDKHAEADLEMYEGALIPGFINTHCHLELSHMIGAVDTGIGLIPFITGVVTQRGNFTEKQIQAAIRKGDRYMWRNGIMAVGDISNAPDTFATKARSKMRYYTFVELFDFLQEGNAAETFVGGKQVFDKLNPPNGSEKSYVPHAPYSVSKSLFEHINEANSKGKTVSIHNQETPPENELFLSKTGAFIDFYGGFGIPLDKFKKTKKTAIHYAIEQMDSKQRTLFVHNTLTTKTDIAAAHAWSKNVYWASCPNANLYIENRLPNYQIFIDAKANVTLGTDSLTSNWQLSILEEMKTIHRFQRYVPFDLLLEWATLNGAKALGFDRELGSLEVGKKPGLLLLKGLGEDGKLGGNAKVKRLV